MRRQQAAARGCAARERWRWHAIVSSGFLVGVVFVVVVVVVVVVVAVVDFGSSLAPNFWPTDRGATAINSTA